MASALLSRKKEKPWKKTFYTSFCPSVFFFWNEAINSDNFKQRTFI